MSFLTFLVISLVVLLIVNSLKEDMTKEVGGGPKHLASSGLAESRNAGQEMERRIDKERRVEQERQRQAAETSNYLRQNLTDDATYRQLANYEDRYYSIIVDRDFNRLDTAQDLSDLGTVQGRVAYLKRHDTDLLKRGFDFFTDYRKYYPEVSLSECREAFLTAVGRPYGQEWVRPNYFLDTAEDVTDFFAGRKPNNGQRLIAVERSKNQLRFFGYTYKDVKQWVETDCYGMVVYLAFDKKSARYQLVYRVTEYDRYAYLSERFKDFLDDRLKPRKSVSPKPKVKKKPELPMVNQPEPQEPELETTPTRLSDIPVSRPSWYDDLDQAIQNEKLPILKDGRDVRTIDWLTEPSLPVFSGIDVYRFATDLDTLGNIMMIAGKHFVGQPAGDWIRFINEKSFGRKRMTKGYQQVYRKALLRLEERQLIRLRQGIVSAVASKEEPILTTKRLPKALQGEKE